LVGAGAARLLSPRREWIPQLTLGAVLASELQDADFWLYLIHPSYYGRYHRVASHNVWALAAIAVACAALAWLITRVKPWRRFGWFVANNLPRDSLSPHDAIPAWNANPVSHAGIVWFIIPALAAAYLHFLGDVITGFGNVMPFWPWSHWDASLHAVSSFDVVIFSLTLAWHIVLRRFPLTRGKEWGVTGVYAGIVVLYVAARWIWGEPTVW
jgi:membrane-bound metal-dependent hydrolase YbcI (DUF457 family)